MKMFHSPLISSKMHQKSSKVNVWARKTPKLDKRANLWGSQMVKLGWKAPFFLHILVSFRLFLNIFEEFLKLPARVSSLYSAFLNWYALKSVRLHSKSHQKSSKCLSFLSVWRSYR